MNYIQHQTFATRTVFFEEGGNPQDTPRELFCFVSWVPPFLLVFNQWKFSPFDCGILKGRVSKTEGSVIFLLFGSPTTSRFRTVWAQTKTGLTKHCGYRVPKTEESSPISTVCKPYVKKTQPHNGLTRLSTPILGT